MALTDNILAYWNLNNNGSGGVSLVDSTGNGYTLTNNNNVTLGAGIISGDGVFNNTNSLTCSYPTGFGTGDFAISCWVNPNGGNDYFPALLSTRDGEESIDSLFGFGYSQGLGSNGIYFFDDNTGDYSPYKVLNPYVPPTGQWTHIVATRASGILTIYYNGGNGVSGSDTNNYSSDVLALGANTVIDTEQNLSGGLDEVGIWGRALSSQEVSDLYSGGAGLTYPFPQTPTSNLYYNNAQNDGNWANLLNWWQNSGFTIQAVALPTATNHVNLYNQVTQNTQGADQCFCASASFWSANFGAGLTLQSTGVVNMQGTSIMAGATTDGVSMHDSSQLASTSVVDGNVTMRDSSRAFGSILGNAAIYYDGGDGQYPIGGTVGGSATYVGWPAVSPQWFNDRVPTSGYDGNFSNLSNWWSDNTYTTRPISPSGQLLPDASTDVFIAPDAGIYANTGNAIFVNSIIANNGYISTITLTVSNNIVFSGNGNYGASNAVIYSDVTFSDSAYNDGSAIHGNAHYTSSASLEASFNQNSLGNLASGASMGSFFMTVNIAGAGGGGMISRLLNLPWFINI